MLNVTEYRASGCVMKYGMYIGMIWYIICNDDGYGPG